jgi:hypothetical protein
VKFLESSFLNVKVIFFITLVVASYFSSKMVGMERSPIDDGISHVMPGQVNILLFAGDRFLASNMLVIRSTVSVGKDLSHYNDQSELQVQAAIVNPNSEDNYYQAAAILPWHGFVEPAQTVLSAARKARHRDPWPAFYEGFNEFYFNKNNIRASEMSIIAADRSTGGNKSLFIDLASKWATGSANYKLALAVTTELEKGTLSAITKGRLKRRIERLNNLISLESNVNLFKIKHGFLPQDLDELVVSALLSEIPVDPWGSKYVIDAGAVKVAGKK